MKSLQLILPLPARLEQVLESARQAAPSLIKLLNRGQPVAHELGLSGTLCRAFGVKQQQDWPLAPVCAAADGLAVDSRDYWLRLDPVHLEVVMGGLLLRSSAGLQLSPTEAHALAAAINLHWHSLGLEIQAVSPTRWYLRLPEAPNLRTTPLDQMEGEYLTPNLPRGADARHFLQLINEVQMLMHSHPVNLTRDSEARPVVNGLWLWAGGNLPAGAKTFDLVASGSFEAQALARHSGSTCKASPESLSELNASGRVLVALTPAEMGGEGQLESCLTLLEQHWFEPLLRQLTRARLQRLRLDLVGAKAVTLTPSQAWRFWR